MMTLPLYGTVKECPACGYEEPFGTSFGETMRRSCCRCNYEWYELPLYMADECKCICEPQCTYEPECDCEPVKECDCDCKPLSIGDVQRAIRYLQTVLDRMTVNRIK
jgi:hypothetical protein